MVEFPTRTEFVSLLGDWTSALERMLLWNLGDFALGFDEEGGDSAYARLTSKKNDVEDDLCDPVLLAGAADCGSNELYNKF